jgi:chemotaxis protein MotA
MDLTSVIGLVVGFGAILIGNVLEGSHMSAIAVPTAALIVLGGTIGATVLGFPAATLKAAAGAAKAAFVNENQGGIETVIEKTVALAYKARREGIIALEEDAQKTEDPFLKKALTLLSDGMDSKHLEETMAIEMSNLESSREAGAKVFEYAGGISPTIGIIGAVLGLIHVMQNLTDPSKLGGGIAVAFVATVYGVGIANLLLIPLGNKIKTKAKASMVYYEAVLEGILSLQNGDNPRMIEEKLKGFLSPKEKAAYVPQDQKAKGGAAGAVSVGRKPA